MIPTSELKTRDCKLREVENRVTLPVDSNVKVLTTSNDVITGAGTGWLSP